MSTNYYLYTQKKEDKEWLETYGVIYELTEKPDLGYEFHICKKSIGWDPIFCAYDSVCSVTDWERIIFAMPESTIIMDEYGTPIGRKAFMQMIWEWQDMLRNGEFEMVHGSAHGTIEGFNDPDGFYFTLRDFG